MKSQQIVSGLLTALLAGISSVSFAQAGFNPAQLAPNGSTPASQSSAPTSAVVSTPSVAPFAPETVKKDSVNPFNGKTYTNESMQREIESLKIQNALQQERLKQRKDELELFKMEQEALRVMKSASHSTGPLLPASDGKQSVSQNQPMKVESQPLKAIEVDTPIPEKKMAKDRKKLSLKEIAAIEEANKPAAPPKPKEKPIFFTPPTDKNIAEPALIGVVQNDSQKTAILTYNGVTVRVPEGGTIAGQAVTSVGNGKAMWGNVALYATGFVDGPRIERTDFDTANVVNIETALNQQAKNKAAIAAAKGGSSARSAGNLPVGAQQQAKPVAGPVGNSPASRLPPPPPMVNR